MSSPRIYQKIYNLIDGTFTYESFREDSSKSAFISYDSGGHIIYSELFDTDSKITKRHKYDPVTYNLVKLDEFYTNHNVRRTEEFDASTGKRTRIAHYREDGSLSDQNTYNLIDGTKTYETFREDESKIVFIKYGANDNVDYIERFNENNIIEYRKTYDLNTKHLVKHEVFDSNGVLKTTYIYDPITGALMEVIQAPPQPMFVYKEDFTVNMEADELQDSKQDVLEEQQAQMSPLYDRLSIDLKEKVFIE
jgi:hypothetical protein